MKEYSWQKFKNHFNKYNIVISMFEVKFLIKKFFRYIFMTNQKLFKSYKIKNKNYKLTIGCVDTNIELNSVRCFFLMLRKNLPLKIIHLVIFFQNI